MAAEREWRVDIYRDLGGDVNVALYTVDEVGQLGYVGSERFGPFDTASEVTRWLLRHWGPRSGFPLH